MKSVILLLLTVVLSVTTQGADFDTIHISKNRSAEELADIWDKTVSEKVEIWVLTSDSGGTKSYQKFVGTDLVIYADTTTWKSGYKIMKVHTDYVHSISISGENVGWGAGLASGALVGMLTGGLVASFFAPPEPPPAKYEPPHEGGFNLDFRGIGYTEHQIFLATGSVIGLGIGAVVGAILGASHNGTMWVFEQTRQSGVQQ